MVLYPAKNKDAYLWHCSISKFFNVVTLLLKENFNMWVTSGLFCGSVGQMGQHV